MNKRIEELRKEDIGKCDDFQLINYKERTAQLLEKWLWKLPINVEEFFTVYKYIKAEIKKRNIKLPDKRIDEILFKSELFGINVLKMPEIPIIKNFVVAIGEFAKNGKDSKEEKIKVVIRGSEKSDKNEQLEKIINDSVKNQTGKESEFIYSENDINKMGQSLPFYHLMLVPNYEMNRVNVEKKNEISYDERWEIIYNAIQSNYGDRAYISKIYDDYIIVSIYNSGNGQNDLMKVPYKIDAENRTAELDTKNAVEVQMEYVESKGDNNIDSKNGDEIIKADEVLKPYPNEHAARLKEPDEFKHDSFSRKKDGTLYGDIKVPDTASVIWGKLKSNDESNAQSIRFPVKDWTSSKAKKWLRKNKIDYIKFEPAKKKEKNDDYELPEEFNEVELKKMILQKKKDKGNVEHFVYAVVYEPDEEDTQGDSSTDMEIEKAAHWYLENSGQLRIMHTAGAIERDKAVLVESYIAPDDFKVGKEVIKKGTWCVVIKIKDEDLWKLIEDGKITGVSLGGIAEGEE